MATSRLAVADIVVNGGGTIGGSIYAVNDDGSNLRQLVSGNYEKPFVTLDGTVLFTDEWVLYNPSGAVHAYKDGTTRVVTSDPSTAADGVEAGFGDRYVFKLVPRYGNARLRQGVLPSGSTTELTLCKGTPTFPAQNGELSGYWETTEDRATDPAVNPARDQLVFSGCTWRRHWSNDTVAVEDIDYLTSLTPAQGEHWLLRGVNNWSFNDASWSPDGNRLVFLYWRGHDSLGFQREASEGIWTSNADGSNPRQVLSINRGQLGEEQNLSAPRMTGSDRIVFGFTDSPDQSHDGIYSLPANCDSCTMANATLLVAGGFNPAWTPLHIDGPGSGSPGGGSPRKDTTAPVISAFDLHPTTFKAAKNGPSIAAAKLGTRVDYRLSEKARLLVTVKQLVAGRLQGKACKAPSKRNAHGRKCTLLVSIRGASARGGRKGTNSFHFMGRINGRRLTPGNYVLQAVASDAARNSSRQVKHEFRIAP